MRDLPAVWNGGEWWADDGVFGLMPCPEPVGEWDEDALKAYVDEVFGKGEQE